MNDSEETVQLLATEVHVVNIILSMILGPKFEMDLILNVYRKEFIVAQFLTSLMITFSLKKRHCSKKPLVWTSKKKFPNYLIILYPYLSMDFVCKRQNIVIMLCFFQYIKDNIQIWPTFFILLAFFFFLGLASFLGIIHGSCWGCWKRAKEEHVLNVLLRVSFTCTLFWHVHAHRPTKKFTSLQVHDMMFAGFLKPKRKVNSHNCYTPTYLHELL